MRSGLRRSSRSDSGHRHCNACTDSRQVRFERFKLPEHMLVKPDCQSGILEQGQGNIFVGLARVSAKSGVEILRDRIKALGKRCFEVVCLLSGQGSLHCEAI